MTVRSVLGRSPSKFDLADKVKTPSGLVGEIIGLAEYRWTWTYRVRVPGKEKTMYRDEARLTLVKRGTKLRRQHLKARR